MGDILAEFAAEYLLGSNAIDNVIMGPLLLKNLHVILTKYDSKIDANTLYSELKKKKLIIRKWFTVVKDSGVQFNYKKEEEFKDFLEEKNRKGEINVDAKNALLDYYYHMKSRDPFNPKYINGGIKKRRKPQKSYKISNQKFKKTVEKKRRKTQKTYKK